MMHSTDISPTETIRAAQHARVDASAELTTEHNPLINYQTVKTGPHSWDAVFTYADGTVSKFDGTHWS